MANIQKPLVWLHGEIKTPPFSLEARIEAGTLLRLLQNGESIGLPHSRPMSDVAAGCHEPRVRDINSIWRIIYRLDEDAIIIAEVFKKTTRTTPKAVIDNCQQRLKLYDETKSSDKRRERDEQI